MPTLTASSDAGRRVNRMVYTAFFAAALTVLVVGTLSLRSLDAMRTEAVARNRTNQTLLRLSRLQVSLLDAETGERGFLVTGSPDFLQPFHAALSNLENDTVVLHDLSPGDSSVAPDVRRLSLLIGQQLAGLDTAIRLWDQGKSSEVRQLVLAHNNKGVMDQIRSIIARIQVDMIAERERRSAQVTGAADQTRQIVIASMALTILLLGAAVVLLIRSRQAQGASEASAKAAELRMAAVLEQMPLGVLVVDPAGIPQFANHAAKTILGRDIGPLQPVSRMAEVFQVFRGGTDQIYPAKELPIARALRGELVYDPGIEIHSPERIVPVEAWASPIRGASGKMVLALAAFGEISGRVESERVIKESVSRLKQILDSIPLGIIVADPRGVVTFLNRAGRNLLGRDLVDELPNANRSETYQVYVAGTRKLYPAARRGLTRALLGEHVYADDLELHTPDRIVPIEIWSAPVFNGQGDLVMAISAYGEITDRREARQKIMALGERLQNQVDELAAVNQELESFSSAWPMTCGPRSGPSAAFPESCLRTMPESLILRASGWPRWCGTMPSGWER